jgi:tight adherence protein B
MFPLDSIAQPLGASLFAALLAAFVFLLVWGIWNAFGSGVDRQLLRRRLISPGGQSGNTGSGTAQTSLLLGGETGAVSQLLSRFSFTRELDLSLKQSMSSVTPEKFLGVAATIGGVLGLAMFSMQGSFLAGLIGFATGGYLPFIYLSNRRLRRQRMLAEQLPDGLDFLGRSLRAGHSLPVGLQMMGSELPAPLCSEFGKCYDQISLGLPPEGALKEMTQRIDSTDFAFFVTAVLVQRQTGGDLAQVLDNITGMLRQRIQLENQVKAKTAEGRFTGVILAGFPLVMFVIMYLMAPETAGILLTTFGGRCMLGGAVLLSVVGLLVIRKITNVRI